MQAGKDKIDHYADALISIAKASDSLSVIENEFTNLLDFMNESEPLERFLASANIAPPGKRQALREILADSINPLLLDFITMLLTAGDLTLLKPISETFFSKASKENKNISGEIRSAKEISESRISEIEKEVGRILNKKVNLRLRIMPSILGGMLIKVGDFIIDGTVDRQLEDAKRQLLA